MTISASDLIEELGLNSRALAEIRDNWPDIRVETVAVAIGQAIDEAAADSVQTALKSLVEGIEDALVKLAAAARAVESARTTLRARRESQFTV